MLKGKGLSIKAIFILKMHSTMPSLQFLACVGSSSTVAHPKKERMKERTRGWGEWNAPLEIKASKNFE
jgi:hypothetical protein